MKTLKKKYEYLYSGREGSYWIDCEIILEKNGKYMVKFEHPFYENNYFEEEVAKDRVRVIK